MPSQPTRLRSRIDRHTVHIEDLDAAALHPRLKVLPRTSHISKCYTALARRRLYRDLTNTLTIHRDQKKRGKRTSISQARSAGSLLLSSRSLPATRRITVSTTRPAFFACASTQVTHGRDKSSTSTYPVRDHPWPYITRCYGATEFKVKLT